MSLPVKITVAIGTVLIVVICVMSYVLYVQIEQNFQQQANDKMLFSTSRLQSQLDDMKRHLDNEMQQLSESLFTDHEATLADMLATPPDFNTEVVHFAESLRKRTTLQFLSVMAEGGTILSSSEHAAGFGKGDAHPGFPENTPAFLEESGDPRVALQKRAVFGGRTLLLRGGYSLQKELERFVYAGVQVQIQRPNAKSALPGINAFSRTMELDDYHNQPLLFITIAISTKDLMEQRQRVFRSSSVLIGLTLLACLALAHLLSRWISRPLGQLTDAALLMSVGQLDVRVPKDAGGEVGELVNAFNRMGEQLQEKQQQLARTERIAAWQEIAKHLAHEIKNPLTPIRTSITNLRLALEKAPEKFPEIFMESSESVIEEVEKLRRLADEFSRFARLPAPELRPGNLNELIQKCLVLYRDQENLNLQFTPGNIPDFAFDAAQISEVIHNLVRNAIDAMPGAGQLRIATSLLATNEKRSILLSVEDTGGGMNEETAKQIFAPYFTTREKGTGLGLAIVQRIVIEHHGKITVQSTPGSGTRFEIFFELA